jgi:hypothetical protein
MDIEKLATSAIEDAIAKTDYITAYINSGDKEPCWDGFFVHNFKCYVCQEILLKFTLPKGVETIDFSEVIC